MRLKHHIKIPWGVSEPDLPVAGEGTNACSSELSSSYALNLRGSKVPCLTLFFSST